MLRLLSRLQDTVEIERPEDNETQRAVEATPDVASIAVAGSNPVAEEAAAAAASPLSQDTDEQQHGEGDGPAASPPGEAADNEDEDGPIPPPAGTPSVEDQYRMASAYARAFPRETADARATLYGDENRHFTVQRARVQVSLERERPDRARGKK